MTSDFLARIEELKKSSDEGLQGELVGMREMLEQIEKDWEKLLNGDFDNDMFNHTLQTYAEALK